MTIYDKTLYLSRGGSRYQLTYTQAGKQAFTHQHFVTALMPLSKSPNPYFQPSILSPPDKFKPLNMSLGVPRQQLGPAIVTASAHHPFDDHTSRGGISAYVG